MCAKSNLKIRWIDENEHFKNPASTEEVLTLYLKYSIVEEVLLLSHSVNYFKLEVITINTCLFWLQVMQRRTTSRVKRTQDTSGPLMADFPMRRRLAASLRVGVSHTDDSSSLFLTTGVRAIRKSVLISFLWSAQAVLLLSKLRWISGAFQWRMFWNVERSLWFQTRFAHGNMYCGRFWLNVNILNDPRMYAWH